MAIHRSGLAVALASALWLGASPAARADTLDLAVSSNANLADTDGNGSFETINDLAPGSYGLPVTYSSGAERRPVLEFDLAPLAGASTIDAISFTFQTTSYANGSHTIQLVGFADDGVADLADATAAGTVLGSYDYEALGLGTHTIALDTATLQSLLGSASYLAIRLQSPDLGANTSIAGREQGSFFTAPYLTVRFQSVPEPSSLALCGLALAMAAGHRLARRRRPHAG